MFDAGPCHVAALAAWRPTAAMSMAHHHSYFFFFEQKKGPEGPRTAFILSKDVTIYIQTQTETKITS
jgi:hypothetical protein